MMCNRKQDALSRRGIGQVRRRDYPAHSARMEMDSHADTCCAGSSFRLIEYTGQTCTVAPFTTTLSELKDVPIVKAATAYDDPITGETLVLVLAQALWFGDKLENSLICPNQLCNNGLKVEDTPQ